MLKLSSQPAARDACILNLRMLNLAPMERHERIAKAIAGSGLKKGEVAKVCGVANSAVTQWINGDSKSLKPENLFALAKATGFNAQWLATGEGPERAQEHDAPASEPSNVSMAVQPNAADTADLLGLIATPRSRQILARIAKAARDGRLTEDDLDLLDKIAMRFEGVAANPSGEQNAGSLQRLRDKLTKNDRDSQQ